MRRYLVDLHGSWGLSGLHTTTTLWDGTQKGEYVPGLDGSGDCAVGLEVLAAAARMRAVVLHLWQGPPGRCVFVQDGWLVTVNRASPL